MCENDSVIGIGSERRQNQQPTNVDNSKSKIQCRLKSEGKGNEHQRNSYKAIETSFIHINQVQIWQIALGILSTNVVLRLNKKYLLQKYLFVWWLCDYMWLRLCVRSWVLLNVNMCVLYIFWVHNNFVSSLLSTLVGLMRRHLSDNKLSKSATHCQVKLNMDNYFGSYELFKVAFLAFILIQGKFEKLFLNNCKEFHE